MSQVKFYRMLFFLSMLFSVNQLTASQEEGNPSTLIFNLDECTSYTSNGTNQDFSEFTASIINGTEVNLSLVGDHLYRNNPTTNGHSCTPGLNGTEAMCVSYDPSCNYTANNDRAVRFDIQLEPLANQEAQLQQLSFYELAPETFDWIDGISGDNNYPLYFGVRILKNGITIYEQSQISATNEWSIQEFDFTSNPDFVVSETTIFNFELHAYCPIGNGASQSVWDLEDISVVAGTVMDPVVVNGGQLEGGPFVFCVDGVTDNVSGITLSGNEGPSNGYIVTDNQGNILGLPPTPEVVDFDEAGAGVCLIYHISYEAGLTGLVAGNNLTDLSGNFDLSNSITVYREIPDGGTVALAGGGTTYTGTAGDIVFDVTHTTTANFLSYWYIITDDNDIILDWVNSANGNTIDASGAPAGTCRVWGWSYQGLPNPVVGENISTLTDDACEDISSNFITVVREEEVGNPIVINEISSDNEIEFLNVGNTSVDISSYWICDFPAYDQIVDLTILCGDDLILDPGEFVTVVATFNLSENDGEMGLYSNAQFGNSGSILDYVEWGSSGHTRASVAISAGIWTAGDFVPSFSTGSVIEYDGSGNSSSDWSEDVPSACVGNLSPPELLEYSIYPNPSVGEINLEFEVDVIGEMNITILSLDGNVQKEFNMNVQDSKGLRIDDLANGTYYLKVINNGQVKLKPFVVIE